MNLHEAFEELDKLSETAEALPKKNIKLKESSLGYSVGFYNNYLEDGYKFVFNCHDVDNFKQREISEPSSSLTFCCNMNEVMSFSLPDYWEIYYKVDDKNKIVTVYDAPTHNTLMCSLKSPAKKNLTEATEDFKSDTFEEVAEEFKDNISNCYKATVIEETENEAKIKVELEIDGNEIDCDEDGDFDFQKLIDNCSADIHDLAQVITNDGIFDVEFLSEESHDYTSVESGSDPYSFYNHSYYYIDGTVDYAAILKVTKKAVSESNKLTEETEDGKLDAFEELADCFKDNIRYCSKAAVIEETGNEAKIKLDINIDGSDLRNDSDSTSTIVDNAIDDLDEELYWLIEDIEKENIFSLDIVEDKTSDDISFERASAEDGSWEYLDGSIKCTIIIKATKLNITESLDKLEEQKIFASKIGDFVDAPDFIPLLDSKDVTDFIVKLKPEERFVVGYVTPVYFYKKLLDKFTLIKLTEIAGYTGLDYRDTDNTGSDAMDRIKKSQQQIANPTGYTEYAGYNGENSKVKSKIRGMRKDYVDINKTVKQADKTIYGIDPETGRKKIAQVVSDLKTILFYPEKGIKPRVNYYIDLHNSKGFVKVDRNLLVDTIYKKIFEVIERDTGKGIISTEEDMTDNEIKFLHDVMNKAQAVIDGDAKTSNDVTLSDGTKKPDVRSLYTNQVYLLRSANQNLGKPLVESLKFVLKES